MKKTKLRLNELNVKSFTTSMDAKTSETIKGGHTGCPWVCYDDPNFTQKPGGCPSGNQLVCTDFEPTGPMFC